MIRNMTQIDDDISRKKRIIEHMLYEDPDIVEIINNPDVDSTTPDELVFQNIFPFIRVPNTQDVAQNYITFAIDDNNVTHENSAMKDQYIRFVVFVHKDLIKTKYDIPRHDIIAYLIRDIFHLSNKLGAQAILVSNIEGITDTNYYTRSLRFRLVTPNSIKPLQTNPYEFNDIYGR